MLFEIADGAHDLRGIEGVHLARQDDEVGAQRRLNQDIAIIAGGVDDDDVVAVQPIDRLVRTPDEKALAQAGSSPARPMTHAIGKTTPADRHRR